MFVLNLETAGLILMTIFIVVQVGLRTVLGMSD